MAWGSYNNNADIIEITIKDFSGAKIESYRCSCADKPKIKQLLKIINSKYGIFEDSDRDIDWLKGNSW